MVQQADHLLLVGLELNTHMGLSFPTINSDPVRWHTAVQGERLQSVGSQVPLRNINTVIPRCPMQAVAHCNEIFGNVSSMLQSFCMLLWIGFSHVRLHSYQSPR
jgi:hypothetical protein